MRTHDVAIVGAGMAGASLAAALAPHGSVLLIEGESAPGYHATGRSAAFWSETYGGPGVQPLTTASGAALRAGGFVEPLGSLHIGRASDAAAIEAFLAAFDGSGIRLEPADPGALVPGMRPDWTLGVLEPSSAYIDVAALHADYLARARRAGAELVVDAPLRSAARAGGRWAIDTGAGAFAASILVNAAGAWADPVARLAGAVPLGIQPYRRTMVQLRAERPARAGLPLVADIGGQVYFKPEAGGRLWLSPHDETPVDPCDVQPEEIDVAIAIDRFEAVVDWRVAALERRWAGLRSFAPDRLPVYGFDPPASRLFLVRGPGRFRHPDRARRSRAGRGAAARTRAGARRRRDRPGGLSAVAALGGGVTGPKRLTCIKYRRRVAVAHKFVIEQNKKGEYVAKFKYNSELIWWTEGYSSKASAKNAIESVLKNGPGAPVEEA